MTNLVSEFDKLQDDIDKTIRTVVAGLDTEFKLRTPVDTSFLKNSWDLERLGKLSWRISNNADYADYALLGRRIVNGKMVGSEQLPDGIQPIIIKYDDVLQKRLKDLRR